MLILKIDLSYDQLLTFPSIIMHVITNIIPTQRKSNQLTKAMLIYWEIIEK